MALKLLGLHLRQFLAYTCVSPELRAISGCELRGHERYIYDRNVKTERTHADAFQTDA